MWSTSMRSGGRDGSDFDVPDVGVSDLEPPSPHAERRPRQLRARTNRVRVRMGGNVRGAPAGSNGARTTGPRGGPRHLGGGASDLHHLTIRAPSSSAEQPTALRIASGSVSPA